MSRSAREETSDLPSDEEVRTARKEIVQELGPLAAASLEDRATARMRLVLQRATSPAVRHAIRRAPRPEGPRPPLAAVPLTADGTASACSPAPLAGPRSRQLTSVAGVAA